MPRRTAVPKVLPAPLGRRVGRPARITREGILDAAEKIPLGTLTLPLLAERLGVRAPALYRHFESRDALLAALGSRRYSELRFPPPDPARWRDWLSRVATDLYEMFCGNPVLLVVPDTRHIPSGLAMYEAALETLVGAGFSDLEAAFIYASVTGNVRSHAISRTHVGSPLAKAFEEALTRNDAGYPHTRALLASMGKGALAESAFLSWLVSSLPEPARRRRA